MRTGHRPRQIQLQKPELISHVMISALLILLALVAAALLTELIAAEKAPFGYQDESGFHFGHEGLANAGKSSPGKPS